MNMADLKPVLIIKIEVAFPPFVSDNLAENKGINDVVGFDSHCCNWNIQRNLNFH